MTQPMVSVIILNWNGASLLEEFLPSVVNYTPADKARVIVADNGSTDQSLTVLRQKFPHVELWEFDRNYGFAGGYNRALDRCTTPYAVLLNSDVAVDSDWITPLLDYMRSHPQCGACQPKILSYRNPNTFEYAGAAGGFIDRNGYPYCRGRLMDSVEHDSGQYDGPPVEIFWATGAAMMVSVEAYRRAGGLDEAFFAHMEEIDLCWRMQLLGYTIAAVTQSHVYHLGGASLDASNPRKTLLNFRNSLLMMYKNLPRGRSRTATLLRRRLLDILAWAQFIIKSKWGHARAIVQAHRQFSKMKANYACVAPPNIDLLHTHPRRPNLLVDYYLRRKKKFSQLK